MMTRHHKPANGGLLRVVGYARVSTDEQKQHGVSLASQKERIAAFCSSRGWELVRTFTDVASGKDMKRDSLKDLLRRAKNGEFEVVVVVKLDRLTRRVIDFALLQETLEEHNVGLASVTETIDTTTPIGRAMAGILAVFAQMERELISERTRDALKHKRDHGEPYGPTPFGYTRRGDRLLLDAKRLAVVEDIFTMRKSGKTLQAIANSLMSQRIAAPRGGKVWGPETVRIVLNNPLYRGGKPQ